MKKIISWILLVAFTIVFVVQDVKLSWAMHSGSTDSVSAFSGNLIQAQAIQSFQPDLFTGQARTSVPLFVPPGRKGIQPSLALSYSNGGGNGWLGVGWGLEVGSIQRSTKFGPPRYDMLDTFVFSFQGVQSELVPIGGGEYRAKDEGLFLKFTFNGSSWVVWDKNGIRYSFGSSDSSRQISNGRYFKWCLDRLTDTNGNYMTISYLSYSDEDNKQLYLSQIAYTGNEVTGETPTHTVEFFSPMRIDPVYSFIIGNQVIMRRRLEQVDMKVSGQLARRYALSYRQSARTGRSLLESVTEYGKDGVASLPPTRFSYQETDDTTFNFLTNNSSNAGDNRWNIRTASVGYSELPVTLQIMLPDGQRIGVCGGEGVPPVTLGATHTESSGSDNGVSWVMNRTNGRIQVTANRGGYHHIWTYVYVNSPKRISIPFRSSYGYVGWSRWATFHNGRLVGHYECGTTWDGVNVDLVSGWNLIEITGVSQDADYTFFVDYDLAANVDIMSSKQSLSPQLTGDFNGDGVTDLATFDPNTGTVKVAPSCCFTFLPSEVWITGFGNLNTIPMVGDVNHDGKSDLLMFDKPNGNWRVALSNGTNAFTDQGNWMTGYGVGKDPFMGDFNGDGKQDIGFFDRTGNNWHIARGNGSGFVMDQPWLYGWGESDTKVLTGDVNGDGFTDLMSFGTLSGNWRVAFSNGARFIPEGTFVVTGFGANQDGFVADQNGDGLADIGYLDSSSGTVYVKPGIGNGYFGTTKNWVTFSITGSNLNFQPAEFTGDGAIDPSVFDPMTQRAQVAMSSSSFPDLLSRIENGRGGTTTITYRSSAGLDNKGEDGLPDLPLVLPVVDQVAVSDGLGNEYITHFTFKGGLFDIPEREFRGFREARVVDANQNQSVHLFFQDDIYKGRLQQNDSLDGNGNRFSETINTWGISNPYPGVHFVRLDKVDSYLFDGGPAYKRRTATSYGYDNYGNIVRIMEHGEYDISGDERLTNTTYVYNPSTYIVNRPAETWTTDGEPGPTVSRTSFYYDGNTNLTDPPTKGNLTRQEEWLQGGISPATIMTYDTYGNLLTVTDARGASTTNTYDETYHIYITSIMNAAGHIQTMTYNPKTGQILTSTDANGKTTTNVYDPLGRIAKTIGPLDSETYPTVSYEYDLSTIPNRVISRSRIEHAQAAEYVTYTFTDGLGRTIQTRLPSEDPTKQVVQGNVSFDARGLVKEQWMPSFENFSTTFVVDANRPKITFLYEPHPMARRTRVNYPDGTSMETQYDGWKRTEIDPNGHSKRYFHDAYGRLIQVDEVDGYNTYTTYYRYDAKGNLVQCIDAQGNIVTIAYDTLGRKVAMSDPDMGNWTYAYDPNGNLITQTDAKGQTIQFTYDLLNRVTQKVAVVSGALPVTLATYTYDTGTNGVGRLSLVDDRSGSTSFGYDVLGRTISETKTVSTSSYTFTRSYDALSRLKTLTYPDGEAVTYTYNELGDVETISGFSSYVTNVDYNAAGQITKIAYGNGVTTDYTYNPQSLRLSSLQTRNNSAQVLQYFNYSFDAVGNVTQIQDNVHTATQSFTYDALNRLTSATGSYGNFTYQYDSIGNLTNKEGVLQTYGVSGVGKPHTITSASNGMSFEYDPNGNMTAKRESGNLVQALRYDVENRLVEVINENSSQNSMTYTLSPGWNFISFPILPANKSISNVLFSLTFGADYLQVSRYNATTQKFEHYVGDSQFNDFTAFEEGRGYEIFISNPNGVTLAVQGNSSSVSTSLKNGYNLIGTPGITSISKEEALGSLVQGTDYDTLLGYNGSSFVPVSTLEAGKSYFLHALRKATWTPPQTPKTTRFTYDGDGGRVKKELLASDGSLITSIIYIGGLYEKTGSQVTKYILLGDQRIAQKDSSGTSFIHTDHLGSSNVVTDSLGNKIQLLQYTPYGTVSRSEGSKDVSHKFTGQRFDDTTGLYFYNARYYDPELGRFISPDTIVPSPSNPQDLNRYTYANNNPINYVDPTGHGWFKKFWSSIVGAASLVLSILAPPLAPALWALNTGISAYNAVQNNNLAGFFAGLAGGYVFGAIGESVALGMASKMSESFLNSFAGGFALGAVEFGIGGFGSGLFSAAASGGDAGDVFRSGLIGAGIGGGIGGVIQGSYMAGWQNTLHGAEKGEIAQARAAYQRRIHGVNTLSAGKWQSDIYGKNFGAKFSASFTAAEFATESPYSRAALSIDKFAASIGVGKGVAGELSFKFYEGSNELRLFDVGDTRFSLHYDLGVGLGVKGALSVDQSEGRIGIGGYAGPGGGVEIRYRRAE